MDESEENMSAEDVLKVDSNSSSVKKPKKRSVVERELETNLTSRITSPVLTGDGLSTSRYGRARRLKTEIEPNESRKIMTESLKSPKTENTPVKVQSPAYKMHASNSPCKKETPKKALETYLDNQIDNIYQENISLSRFSDEATSPSPAKKFPKVYIRKDLIQNREAEETIMLIKNLFSPTKSDSKLPRRCSSILDHSSEKKSLKQNGHVDNASVVKALDFGGGKKKKKENVDQKILPAKNELFEFEAKCPYQVGDLAWARMGTFPFWPCIVTREPSTDMFVKKKMFGRVEHDIIHVTFFGDNGRRSWIVDNMLRNYLGVLEFQATRQKFTAEDKKKDPKLYAAFFISEKKQALWNNSVEEAEILLREPKRLRIDIFNDMLWKSRASKKQKSGKIARTDSDVSLSESLYDSLFSEDDVKSDDAEKSKNKSRKTSFDVSEVVTACLDNMAAKTGITKIQRQSHMDRWLQKAKSKTPEKIQPKPQGIPQKVERTVSSKSKKKVSPSAVPPQKRYSLRKSNESQSTLSWNSNKLGKNSTMENTPKIHNTLSNANKVKKAMSEDSGICVIPKVESLPHNDINQESPTIIDEQVTSNLVTEMKDVLREKSDSAHAEENKEVIDVVIKNEKEADTIEKMDTSVNNDISNASSDEIMKNQHQKESDNCVEVGKELNSCEANQNSAVDVEGNPGVFIAGSDENSNVMAENSETVSKESLEDIKVQLPDDNINVHSETCMKDKSNIDNETGMKVTLNDVTNEASVTESKNDDTINMGAEERVQQESCNKPEILHKNKTDNDINFLEITNSHVINLAEKTLPESSPKNTSTPEKNNKSYKIIDVEMFNDKITKKELKETKETLTLNNSINCGDSKDRENSYSRDNGDEDLAENDILNESGNSESILQFTNDETGNENGIHTTLESTIKTDTYIESDNSISLLQKSQITESLDKSDTEVGSYSKISQHDNLEDDGKSITLGENVSSARSNVESPTFTQLLESEEFFQSVNKPCFTKDTSQNISNKIDEEQVDEPNSIGNFEHKVQSNDDKQTNKLIGNKGNEPNISNKTNVVLATYEEMIVKNDVSKDVNNTHSISNKNNANLIIEQRECNYDEQTSNKIDGQNVNTEEYEEEELSDDEPSPEYESLDEDITEDFRKHMKSIESNITDKKDEEQIVKICNEIAEKAKLSPTKYVDLTYETSKGNERDDIEKQVKSRSPKELITKEEKPKENVKSKDIKAEEIAHNADVTVVHHKDVEIKINGNANELEILNKAKRNFRPRLSLNTKTTKKRTADNKPPKNKLNIMREHSKKGDLKVIITPLDKETMNNHLKTKIIESKPLEEDQKSNNKSRPRLSLKRASPKLKPIETSPIENIQPDIKVEESKRNIDIEPVDKKGLVTTNIEPQQLNKENSATEQNKSEPVLLNGYLNHVDRKLTNTPNLEDKDFDIDTVSLNSEDSEVSLPHSVECVPKRNLRSRPERTLEFALKSPEFLKYLELRQDFLLDEHPDLNEDEVLTYVYKTWQYEEESKSDVKKSDDAHHSNLVKGIRRDTPSRKKSNKSQPKHSLENNFREKYDKCSKTIDFGSSGPATSSSSEFVIKQDTTSDTQTVPLTENSENKTEENTVKKDTRPKSPAKVNLTTESNDDVVLDKDKCKDFETVSINSEDSSTPRKSLRTKTCTPKSLEKQIRSVKTTNALDKKVKEEPELDTESIDSEDSEITLRQLRSKVLKENKINVEKERKETPTDTGFKPKKSPAKVIEPMKEITVKDEVEDTACAVSDNEPLLKRKKKVDKSTARTVEDPEFIKYIELRQDALMDENPQLSRDDIVSYLFKTWLYEENSKSEMKKNDELEQATLIKGLNNNEPPQPKKVKRKPKIDKITEEDIASKEKPRRRIVQPYYNEDYSDIEEELEVFEIFKTKKTAITAVSKVELDKSNTSKISPTKTSKIEKDVEIESGIKSEVVDDEVEFVDQVELYFTELTKPKPSVFKGLIREKVCEVCEREGNLVKCKGCLGTFHVDCVKKQSEIAEMAMPLKVGRKKKKASRRRKSVEDSESQSDEKSQDASVDMSIEEIPQEICTFDAERFESQLAEKMKELLDNAESNYYSYSSDDGVDWGTTVAGKCEIVDVKFKCRSPPVDYSDFKCNNCQKYDTPVCFVCKSAISKSDKKMRQKCHVAHCHKYYHLECLDHWPQTQFNYGEPSRNNKKVNEFFETLACPRHVCHTCVSDDPRGCKTRFTGDKLAKCVRCPATYHSFNKCLPAGTHILTASHIICPRHYEHRPGKISYHVNTGWCFLCAQGGSLICCEYCPTSFHAECLNIKPPEGNYMCEDCETGRLPLYGEMVWVKLGNYRWWPGLILHPSEIPENLILMKHGIGEFVVRFFGQYDHYWVNRGRVFPYQEGDSGRISSQKSKIDAAFTTAIEHAQRAYEILKNAETNDEESIDIASSLLPPHYVKLKCNKPCGSLCGKKIEDPSLSLTQCECNPDDCDPCGPYSHCLNRMLLTECGPTCRAGDRCNNRAFEKRLYPKLVPYKTPHRGWGLKTLEDIKAGQFVIEYVGELIDEEEFRRRMRRKHEIRDENFYFLTLDKERMIDAGPKGNLARFMNHCCEPNCETQKWTVLGDIRVGLFAINDIPANSEVTFNYKLECEGIEKKRCMCGAKRCSGYIGAKPKQDESQTKKSKDSKLPGKRTYKKKKVEDSPSTPKSKLKRPLGRPPKPKELTEIEKDLLIIKNATNGISSDDSSRSLSLEDKNPKTLKRKRISMSTDDVSISDGQEPGVKKQKCEDKPSEVGD